MTQTPLTPRIACAILSNMASINLLGRSRRRRRSRGRLGSAACGPGWKMNKRRTKCIRKRR